MIHNRIQQKLTGPELDSTFTGYPVHPFCTLGLVCGGRSPGEETALGEASRLQPAREADISHLLTCITFLLICNSWAGLEADSTPPPPPSYSLLKMVSIESSLHIVILKAKKSQ